MRQVPSLQNLLFQMPCYSGILCPQHNEHVLENGLFQKAFGPKNNAVSIWGITKEEPL
jgi:hypothetical protein